jgi:hypothetical protein
VGQQVGAAGQKEEKEKALVRLPYSLDAGCCPRLSTLPSLEHYFLGGDSRTFHPGKWGLPHPSKLDSSPVARLLLAK